MNDGHAAVYALTRVERFSLISDLALHVRIETYFAKNWLYWTSNTAYNFLIGFNPILWRISVLTYESFTSMLLAYG